MMRIALIVVSLVAATVHIAPGQQTEQSARIQELEHRLSEMGEQLAKMKTQLSTALSRSELADQRASDLEARLEESQGEQLDTLLETHVALIQGRIRNQEPEFLEIGGYFDLEFRDNQAGDEDQHFDQHRLILKLGAEVTDGIRFLTEIEIEGGGVGAGHLTDSELVVEYAELHFELTEVFNLKIGALLVPFNRYNLLHDSPLQDLTDRPLVDRRVIPTTWADAGIGAYGGVHWDGGSVDYDVVVVNGLTENISSSGGMRGARASYREDNNDNKMVIGRVGLTLDVGFLDTLNIGASFGTGRYDDDNHESITMVGFDLTLKRGAFELVGEYAQIRFSRSSEQRMAGIPRGMQGWYVEARFHFFPESWRGTHALLTNSSTFTLVARYGQADTDIDHTAVDFGARGDRYRDDRRRLTVGFNFRPVERTVIKLEYQIFFEPSSIPDVDNNRLVASFATYF